MERHSTGGLSRRMFVLALALGAGGFFLRRNANAVFPFRPGVDGAPSPRRAASLDVTVTDVGIEMRPVPLEPDGPVYRLNDTAALIWEQADGSRSVLDIAQRVSAEYGVSGARALRDTATFLQSLSAAGLTFGFSGRG